MSPSALVLREWQSEALSLWQENNNRGIVGVVTGGGKTVFALACIEASRASTALVVVPTVSLLDQWVEEVESFFDMRAGEVNVISKSLRLKSGTVNVGVINTVAKLAQESDVLPTFLIVDECHRAATPRFSTVLNLPKYAALGLSATPERQYDDGFTQHLIPTLGPLIFEYTYEDALRDGVIVPFTLRNVVFSLEPEVEEEYEKVTVAIRKSIHIHGIDDEKTVRLLLTRARIQNSSLNRVRHTVRIAAHHRGERILAFFEDVQSANLTESILKSLGIRAGVYHSQLPTRERINILSDYRAGRIEVLVSCRALDEGFNVPETRIGIIAASTATRRQRIQRLGRALRPSPGKGDAIVYTLAATGPELSRLEEEAASLDGVASISWSRAEA